MKWQISGLEDVKRGELDQICVYRGVIHIDVWSGPKAGACWEERVIMDGAELSIPRTIERIVSRLAPPHGMARTSSADIRFVYGDQDKPHNQEPRKMELHVLGVVFGLGEPSRFDVAIIIEMDHWCVYHKGLEDNTVEGVSQWRDCHGELRPITCEEEAVVAWRQVYGQSYANQLEEVRWLEGFAP